jgi:hypothetical protein
MSFKCKITYTGSTPGADTNVYVLFDSSKLGVTTAGKQCLANFPKAQRFVLSLLNAAAGTLKAYRSENGGTTWTQVFADDALSAATTTAALRDYFIGGFRDFKLEWTNGGSAQTTWLVDMMLSETPVKVT